MLTVVEKTGKTVEDALRAALVAVSYTHLFLLLLVFPLKKKTKSHSID